MAQEAKLPMIGRVSPRGLLSNGLRVLGRSVFQDMFREIRFPPSLPNP